MAEFGEPHDHVFSDIEVDTSSDSDSDLADTECVSDLDDVEDDNLEHNKGDEESDFKKFLIGWAITNCVPRSHVTSLLKGIKTHIEVPHKIDLGLPGDFRSLLKTPRDVSHLITKLDGGRFGNFGLKNGLQRLVKQGLDLSGVKEIKIGTFLDGFSPYTKRSKSFWALLHTVQGLNFKRVFMSGLYVGDENPANFNHLLSNFVEEFNALKATPFKLEGVNHEVILKVGGPVVCDFPAKGHAKGTKASGYDGCDFCEQHGIFHKSVVFPDLHFVLRTNEKFRDHIYGDHHKHISVLENIEELDMVKDFPHDFLHLVLLGAMRRWMQIYFFKSGENKLPTEARNQAVQDFREVANSIPVEFQWKPRNLNKAEFFKGKELRYLLLYAGVVVFQEVLPEDDYSNFLNLSCATRILSCPVMSTKEEWLTRAEDMLHNFVLFVKSKLGQEHCVRVVHGLLHLVEDCRRFGSVNNFSAFPFESFLGSIKYLLRSPALQLEQIMKRYVEQEQLDAFSQPDSLKSKEGKLGKSHSAGPSLGIACSQYKSIVSNEYVITNTFPNNVLLLESGDIVVVDNIVKKNVSGEIFFVTRHFVYLENLFTSPLTSSSLDIVVASQLSETRHLHNIDKLKKKCVLFKRKDNKNVVIPLIH